MTRTENSSRLPEEWEIGILGEDVIVKGRFGWRGYKTTDLRDSGPIVIGGENVKSNPYFDLSNIKYLSREKFDESPEIRLKKGDVLLVQRGNLGDTAYFDGSIAEATINPSIIILSEFKGDSKFLYYYLTSSTGHDNVMSLSSGSSVPAIYQNHVKRLEYPKPPINEQHAIASFLGAFDGKIALNHQMSHTLEAIARAIFKSWFIDFDPVRAKMEGRKQFGMNVETAALLPDSFEDSELGEIPKGWAIKKVSDLTDINKYTFNNKIEMSEIRYVEISEVVRGDILNIAIFDRGEEPSRARRMLRHGDVVISTVRPDRGSYFLAIRPDSNLIVSTGFAVISPLSIPWTFAYCALTDQTALEYYGRRADGGAYPAIRPEVIGEMEFVIPIDLAILGSFHAIVAPLLEKAEYNRLESKTLASLRDLLLPKLISGEIRLPQFREGGER